MQNKTSLLILNLASIVTTLAVFGALFLHHLSQQVPPLENPGFAMQPVAQPDTGTVDIPDGVQESAGSESSFGLSTDGSETTAFNLLDSGATPNPTIPAHAQQRFEGIYYLQEMRITPRRMSIHVVFIDLDTPGLEFLVTPGDPTAEQPLRARTTSQFLTEFGVQVAINGDCCVPWHDRGSLDYYPHAGDPVAVPGFASSQGTIYSYGLDDRRSATIYISSDNQVQFDRPPEGEIYNAVSGFSTILEDGQVQPVVLTDDSIHPRTAFALDQTGRTLILVVVDGRQPWLSAGATLADLVDIISRYGGYTALNMDGGGTSTLVMESAAGSPVVLNSPIHNGVPGTERPGGNHLGVYAPPAISE